MNTPQPTVAELTVSAIEPVTLDLVKRHCAVVANDEDASLDLYLAAARLQVEHDSQLSLVRRTIRQRMQCWPGRKIECVVAPLISVESIEYLDADGATQTLSPDRYYIDADRRPGAIWRKPAIEWPELELDRTDAITITYTAGYDRDTKPAPAHAVQAILLATGHAYKHRESAVVGAITSEMALGYQRLVNLLNKERFV